MRTKIVNSKGQVVYETTGGIGYDHGYWINLNPIQKETKYIDPWFSNYVDPEDEIKDGKTPKKKKWLNKKAYIIWAWPTKKEALNSFIIRKQRQIEILERQLENTKVALRKAENLKKEEYKELLKQSCEYNNVRYIVCKNNLEYYI